MCCLRLSKKPPTVKKQDYILASDKAFSVAVPGALLGANACVAHRPLPLAQVAPPATGGAPLAPLEGKVAKIFDF